MPVTPISLSALLTSSSLNGLMIASIFCIASPIPAGPGVSRPGRAPAGTVPMAGRPRRSLENHPGFDEEPPLGALEPGMAEHEARGRAERLHNRCIGAQEADAQLVRRGDGEREG